MTAPEQLEWTDDMVQRFWDNQSSSVERYFTYKHASNIMKVAAPYITDGAVLLDYGAGRGFLAEEAVRLGYRVGAFDYSPESVKDLRSKFDGNSSFIGVMNYDEVRNVKGEYDFVFMIEVIEHLTDEHIAETVSIVKDVLRPGGRFFLTTPFEEDLKKGQTYCPCCNKFFHQRQHIRSWSVATLCESLTTHGMNMVDCFATDLNFYKKPFPELLMKIKKSFYSLSGRKFKTPHLIAVAEKE